MKRRFHIIGIPMLAAGALMPSLALAAESGSEQAGSWVTLGFFAANFAAFLFILIYFAVPLARSFFTDRAASIRASLGRAESALAEADAIARAAEARKAALESDLARIKAEFETETNFQIARLRELAKAHSERLRHDSQMTTAAMTEAAQRRVRERLAAAAATLAREVIARNFSGDDQGRLIEGFMDKLGQEGRR
ncbi:MAG: F0F1 ATP synthase subunit B family protein [Candidatus Binataceae bacterium]